MHRVDGDVGIAGDMRNAATIVGRLLHLEDTTFGGGNGVRRDSYHGYAERDTIITPSQICLICLEIIENTYSL